MGQAPDFDFGDDSVAQAYDRGLVPVLFLPWADRLLDEFGPWDGRRVLDLASGTGIIASRLAERVGAHGTVVAADINPQMLNIARKRCAGLDARIEFVECSALALTVPDESVDFVVCQQGFQFFPDRVAAAREIFRVLKPGGTAVLSIWMPVDECHFFGAVCQVLDAIGESDVAQTLRVPFDQTPAHEMRGYFVDAGFEDVGVARQEMDLVLPRGLPQALELVPSTPIGPMVRALSEEKRASFTQRLSTLIGDLSGDSTTMGSMAARVVTARKQS